MTLLAPCPDIPTLKDLLERLGGISPARVRFYPAPGSATEADVVEIEARENRLYELIDGVLVEKAMGYRESFLAAQIVTLLNIFVMPRKLGAVTGADGMVRLFPGLVRIPDVAFVCKARLPGGQIPAHPIPDLVPDLAVDVLSESNTKAEMRRKLADYFAAGVHLVWLVDPDPRTVAVFTGLENPTILTEDQTLDGRQVLPGFQLPLTELFGTLDSLT